MSHRARIAAAAVAACTAAPLLVSNEGILYYFSLVLIWSIFALGFDLAFGTAGLLSLGHAAFFGAGAFVHSILMMRAGWPFGGALAAGALAGGLLALLFGVLTIRVSGVFFTLTTQALAEMVYILAATRLHRWTGGVEGLIGVPRPTLAGIDFLQPRAYYALLAVLFLAALGAAALLRASPFGQALRGIRQNGTRAAQLGLNVTRFKVAALTVSGVYSAFAGALLASLMSFVSPQLMQWTVSGDLLIMTLLGGAGTLLGPVLGVAVIEFLREELSAVTQHWYGALGLIFVLCTIFLPNGIAGAFAPRRLHAKQRPARSPRRDCTPTTGA